MSRAEDNMYKLVDRIESIDIATKVSKALLLEMGMHNPKIWRWSVYRELINKMDLLNTEKNRK